MVSRQWEVGHTAFSSVPYLRQLIGAVSHEDVQPQAILAAESLGSGIIVSADRVNEAVTALGGNNSVRLESIGAMIGLRSGELHRMMRQSTGLVQFFLVITACKLLFTDHELGDLAFKMMTHAGTLATFPVSSSQLIQLVSSFSAHSETIAPITVMETIAREVDTRHPTNHSMFLRVDPETLAELFVAAFSNLRDSKVTEVVLRGCESGVWMATVFSWLFQDIACVSAYDDMIIGYTGARLHIIIEPNNSGLWELEVWRDEKDPTRFVCESEFNGFYTSRIPMALVKSYFQNIHARYFENDETVQRAVAALGSLAQAFTCLLVENASLCLPPCCCLTEAEKCKSTSLMNVISTKSKAQYKSAALGYGWNHSHLLDDSAAFALLLGVLPAVRSANSRGDAQNLLDGACLTYLREQVNVTGSPGSPGSRLIEAAMNIALDAALTSSTSAVTGTRYFDVGGTYGHQSTQEVVYSLLTSGLDVRSFRRMAFTRLLPGLEDFHDGRDLAVVHNGYVASVAVLWNCSTLQDHVLAIRYAPGQIERDGFPFTKIREAHLFAYPQSDVDRERVVLFQGGQYHGFSPRCDDIWFETKVSSFGHALAIKTDMVRAKKGSFRTHDIAPFLSNDRDTSKTRVSWIHAIDVLATADHISGEHTLNQQQERELAHRLNSGGLEAQWSSACEFPVALWSGGLLLRTSGHEKLRFFAAGKLAGIVSETDGCIKILVRHDVHLLSCIQAAREGNKDWAICC